MSPFLYAVPLFVTLISVEVIFPFSTGRAAYRFDDSIRNIICGILEEIAAIFSRLATAWVYVLIFQHAALFEVPVNAWGWLFAFLGVDFCYYWFHRASHRVGLLWAMHAVHHQSEFYNLTVALRQSALGGFASWVFYLPLALLGIRPEMTAACYAINLVYQFWIHTEVIHRMGCLEGPLNTPSHHRVHHGRNPAYIDKNYAGTFIVWDKWFGTFIPETERPDYGVVKRLDHQNPLWANVEGWVLLSRRSTRAPTLKGKLYAWIAPPEWEPTAQPPYLPPLTHPVILSPRKKKTVALLFVINFGLVLLFFIRGEGLTHWELGAGAVWFVVSWGALGLYADRK